MWIVIQLVNNALEGEVLYKLCDMWIINGDIAYKNAIMVLYKLCDMWIHMLKQVMKYLYIVLYKLCDMWMTITDLVSMKL